MVWVPEDPFCFTRRGEEDERKSFELAGLYFLWQVNFDHFPQCGKITKDLILRHIVGKSPDKYLEGGCVRLEFRIAVLGCADFTLLQTC